MKKKIFSLILVLMLLPFASLFSACGKSGYNLNNLTKDFNKINDFQNIVVVDNEVRFDYSKHNNLSSILSSTSPYTQLVNYNEVFYNIMEFSSNYIDECSNNYVTKNAEIRNKVEETLNNFKYSLQLVDKNVSLFAEIINISQNDITDDACLLRFEHLLKSYSELYVSAIDFTGALTDLYFSHVLNNSNPDVYSMDSANFDEGVVLSKIKSRISYQKYNLSYVFVETYVNSELAENVANKTTTFNLSNDNYKTNINALNKAITSMETAISKANVESFYTLSVTAQNQQEALNNDKSKFRTACKNVDYIAKVAEGGDLNTTIIDGYFALVKDYNNTLSQMLTIITN